MNVAGQYNNRSKYVEDLKASRLTLSLLKAVGVRDEFYISSDVDVYFSDVNFDFTGTAENHT